MPLANTLTTASNNLIDFSRTGDIFFSGRHHYSMKEIAVRTSMMITTATAAYLGAALNDPEKTNQSDLAMAIAGGLLGLVVSHIFVIAPLIHKRYTQNQACIALVDGIYRFIHDNPDLIIALATVTDVIESILNLNSQTDEHAHASKTWGMRKRLLTNFDTLLKSKDESLISALHDGDIDKILVIVNHQLSDESNEPSTSMRN